jgi:hypothetical protein
MPVMQTGFVTCETPALLSAHVTYSAEPKLNSVSKCRYETLASIAVALSAPTVHNIVSYLKRSLDSHYSKLIALPSMNNRPI